MRWLGVSILLLVIVINGVVVLCGILPYQAFVSALFIVLFEAAKIVFLASPSSVMGNKDGFLPLIVAEGVTFIADVVVVVALAMVGMDPYRNAMLITACADFFLSRAGGCMVLSRHLWR